MKPLKILTFKDPQVSRCPACNEIGSLRRSRAKNTWEQFVKKFTYFSYFRCRECDWRGTKSAIVIAPRAFRALLVYSLIVVITVYIVRMILSKVTPA